MPTEPERHPGSPQIGHGAARRRSWSIPRRAPAPAKVLASCAWLSSQPCATFACSSYRSRQRLVISSHGTLVIVPPSQQDHLTNHFTVVQPVEAFVQFVLFQRSRSSVDRRAADRVGTARCSAGCPDRAPRSRCSCPSSVRSSATRVTGVNGSVVAVGGGSPAVTVVPPRRVIWKALSSALVEPASSNAYSTPAARGRLHLGHRVRICGH